MKIESTMERAPDRPLRVAVGALLLAAAAGGMLRPLHAQMASAPMGGQAASGAAAQAAAGASATGAWMQALKGLAGQAPVGSASLLGRMAASPELKPRLLEPLTCALGKMGLTPETFRAMPLKGQAWHVAQAQDLVVNALADKAAVQLREAERVIEGQEVSQPRLGRLALDLEELDEELRFYGAHPALVAAAAGSIRDLARARIMDRAAGMAAALAVAQGAAAAAGEVPGAPAASPKVVGENARRIVELSAGIARGLGEPLAGGLELERDAVAGNWGAVQADAPQPGGFLSSQRTAERLQPPGYPIPEYRPASGGSLNGKSRFAFAAFNAVLSVLSVFNLELAPREPVRVEVRAGYSPQVEAASVTAPHSIRGLDKYLSSGIPPAAARDMAENGRVVEIHKCAGPEALQSLAERGFTDTSMFAKPLLTGGGGAGGALLLRTASPKTGEIRYALANILGGDLQAHNELQVKYAGVRPENVRVFDHHSDVEALFDAALRKVGEMPERAVIGYPGSFKRDLTQRGVYSRKHRALKAEFGASPYRALLSALQSSGDDEGAREAIRALNARPELEAFLALPSEDIFQRWENIEKMEELAGLLSRAQRRPGPDFRRHRAGKNIEDVLLPSELFTFLTKDGGRSRVLVTRHLYGDLSGKVARRLLAAGVTDLVHVGNAGGLAPGARIGDLHIPGGIYDHGGNVANRELTNGFLEAFRGEPGVLLGTKHATVASPLFETKEFIQGLQAGGFEALEVEASEVARAVVDAKAAGNRAGLSTAILLSDLPASDEDLTLENMHQNETSPEYIRSFHRVVDAVLARWDLRGVELSDAAEFYLPEGAFVNRRLASPWRIVKDVGAILSRGYAIRRRAPQAPRDVAGLAAARILTRAGLNDDRHVLLRENLSDYLFNALSARQLDTLSKGESGLEQVLAEAKSLRWEPKIRRDLSAPYTDEQVVIHLLAMDSELKRTVRAIAALPGGGPPADIYLAGGIVKGRFGASSDIDLLVDVAGDASRDALKESALRKLEAGAINDVMAFPLPKLKPRREFKLTAKGPKVGLGGGRQVLEREDFLLDLYIQTLKKRGISLAVGPAGGAPAQVKARVDVEGRVARRREVRFDWLEAMGERLKRRAYDPVEKRDLRSRLRGLASVVLQTTLGSLLLLPGVGRALQNAVAKTLFAPVG